MNVVVTGATKGIGRAICELMGSNDHNLAICSRNREELAAFSDELMHRFNRIKVIDQVCDVSRKDDISKFSSFVLSKFKTVDVLVNNAGIFIPGATHQEEDGVLEQMIETNLYSAYYMTRSFVPGMIQRKKGHIINMCSIASIMAYPNGGSYSISKYALLGFSKVLRSELKEEGIKVTAVLPGATWSESWKGADFPEERLMQASDIAQAVWDAIRMGPSAVVEEIIVRPQLGDL